MYQPCPVVSGLLTRLRAHCQQANQYYGDFFPQLEEIEKQYLLLPAKFHTRAVRQRRIALCAANALRVSSMLVQELGLELPTPSTFEQTCDALLELCELEEIELALRGGANGGWAVHSFRIRRAKATLAQCRAFGSKVSEYLNRAEEAPSDCEQARECSTQLAEVWDRAELPMKPRVQFLRLVAGAFRDRRP